MILGICEEPAILNVMRLVVLLIKILRVAVPIILIIVMMLRFASAMTKHDDAAVTKAMKSVVPNIIAAVLIFLVPSFVDIVVKISMPNSDYTKCISDITIEKVNQAYNSKMDKLISEVESSLEYSDYTNAYAYLPNIKNSDKRKEYEAKLDAIKELIDEKNKPKTTTPNVENEFVSTGLGKDIVAQAELIEACKWVLHDDELQIRLQTCPPGPYKYPYPEQELPGGAVDISTGQASALKNISLHEYQKGVFFGEEKVENAPDSRYAFMIIYKTVFLHNTVWRAINNQVTLGQFEQIYYNAGSCSQNYMNSLRVSRYDSGAYKEEIDDAVEKTRYLVLANTDGTTTDATYHSFTGIEQQIEKAGAQGTSFVEILENVIKSGNDDAWNYKNARVYDCRNLYDNGTFTAPSKVEEKVDTTSNIIYLGDSRIDAYRGIKGVLKFNDKQETIFATSGAKYDERFFNNMNDAKNLILSNKNKSYAITVNYGVNAPTTMVGFCDYYVNFVNSIDRKNKFIIVSVNPFDESKSVYYQLDDRNEYIEKFNNYMKTTCINRIKEKTPNAQVYYCDSYNSLPLNEWVSKKYIADDGIHYTTAGYKYIYDYTKKCVSNFSK